MSAGSQISPRIDTSFLCSLCPNQIIKIALIKLTDTNREAKGKQKFEGAEKYANGDEVNGEKVNKKAKRCDGGGPIGLGN